MLLLASTFVFPSLCQRMSPLLKRAHGNCDWVGNLRTICISWSRSSGRRVQKGVGPGIHWHCLMRKVCLPDVIKASVSVGQLTLWTLGPRGHALATAASSQSFEGFKCKLSSMSPFHKVLCARSGMQKKRQEQLITDAETWPYPPACTNFLWEGVALVRNFDWAHCSRMTATHYCTFEPFAASQHGPSKMVSPQDLTWRLKVKQSIFVIIHICLFIGCWV